MEVSKCVDCKTDKKRCVYCKDNVIYRDIPRVSLYTRYKPLCPAGMLDCVDDPAYLKYYFPKEFERLYGNIKEENIVGIHCTALDDNKCNCYNDGGK